MTCLFLSVLLSFAARGEQKAEPGAILVPNFSVRRSISTTPQSFELQLQPGEFVRIDVEQLGGDILLTASTGGQIVDRADAKLGREGRERLSLIASIADKLDIRVSASKPDQVGGEYELRVSEWRKSNARDTKRVGAERLLNEADEARNRDDAASLTLAADIYSKGIPLAEEAEDLELRAELLRGLGSVQKYLDQNVVALETLLLAAGIARQANLPDVEADALTFRGAAHDSLGDTGRALESYELALPLWRKSGSRTGLSTTLNNMGVAIDILGDKRKALQHYQEALDVARAIGEKLTTAVSLSGIAKIHDDLGEPQAAIDGYYEALKIATEEQNLRGQASLLSNIGLVYQKMGDPEKALELYKESLPLRRKSGHRQGEVTTLNNIGRALFDLWRYEKASENYHAALALSVEISDKRGQAAALFYLALLAEAEGNAAKALEQYEKSLKLRREIMDTLATSVTLDRVGVVRASLGDKEEALKAYDEALILTRQAGYLRGEFEILLHRATLAREKGELDAAHRSIVAALEIAESVRLKPAAQELRAAFFALVQRAFSEEIEVLMDMHRRDSTLRHDIQALEVAERARARSLLDLLSEARADIRRGVDPAMLARQKQLSDRLVGAVDRESRLLRGKHNPEAAASAAEEVNKLTSDYRQLGASLRATSPAYASLTRPEPLKFSEFRELIDSQTVVLEYRLGKPNSYLWLISGQTVQSYVLASRETIEAAVKALYSRLSRNPSSRSGSIPEGDELAGLLLSPVVDQIRDKRLIIIPDGALYYLPFGALALEMNAPLIRSHEVAVLPSMSMLPLLRASGKSPRSRSVIVFADPVFDIKDERVRANARTGVATRKNTAARPAGTDSQLVRSAESVGLLGAADGSLPRLPFTRREAEAILRVTSRGGGRAVLDFDAERSAVLSADLTQYKIVHFATHGMINSEHPELSGLVLSLVDREGSPQPGFVQAFELFNLNLAAGLVVLSGCQTALGKEVRGEGLLGLTRAFMYAGAPRVVASLWKVDDVATAEMMRHFYSAMLGQQKLRPAAALRVAQNAMLRQDRWSDPYFWAGFVMQGDWE